MESKNITITDFVSDIDQKIALLSEQYLLLSVSQSFFPGFPAEPSVNEVELQVLNQLRTSPGLTAKELIKTTRRSKGTLSTMLSNLEKKKLIQQKSNPENFRERMLFLTEAGKDMVLKNLEYKRKWIFDFLMEAAKKASPEEIQAYFKLCGLQNDILSRSISKHEE